MKSNSILHLLPACFVGLFATVFHAPSLFAEESALWGKNGESWTPKSRLPDFSFAGYHFGEAQPPTPPVDVSVKDFGAVGDGKTDDTEAFKRAVTEARGKAILIPKGIYVLSDRIKIDGHGTVLRGESRDESVLLFTKGLEELYPSPTKNDGGQPTSGWSWAGGLLSVESKTLHGGAKFMISGAADQGSSSVTLENAGALQVGEFVVMYWSNDQDNNLAKQLYAGDGGDISGLAGQGSMRRLQVNKIAKVEGNEVELVRPLRLPIKPEFGCHFIKLAPETSECGIERLTLKFESGIYRAHFAEQGFNAIAISQNALHCWVRQLRIIDADSGIFGAGTHGTMDDILFEAKRRSLTPNDIKGHHGVEGSSDCLIQNVRFECSFIHDVTVSAHIGNVFRLIQGKDINMDHHRWGPSFNLFTNLDLGDGQRPWASGGGGSRGKHAAAGTTFWNLRSKKFIELPDAEFGPPPLQFIGIKMRGKDQRKDDVWWVETIQPGKLEPQDLYLAQLQKRLAEGRRMYPVEQGVAPVVATMAVERDKVHEWRNTEGRTVTAKFGGLKDGSVALVLGNGQRYVVPLEKLDAASQQLARTLAGGGP